MYISLNFLLKKVGLNTILTSQFQTHLFPTFIILKFLEFCSWFAINPIKDSIVSKWNLSKIWIYFLMFSWKIASFLTWHFFNNFFNILYHVFTLFFLCLNVLSLSSFFFIKGTSNNNSCCNGWQLEELSHISNDNRKRKFIVIFPNKSSYVVTNNKWWWVFTFLFLWRELLVLVKWKEKTKTSPPPLLLPLLLLHVYYQVLVQLLLHGTTQKMEENGTRVAKWGREEEKKKMEEEEQGRSVHENNIMGEAISMTIIYTKDKIIWENKSLQHMRKKESERNDCCFFLLPHEKENRFHMREKEMIVSSFVVASTWDKGLFSTMRKRWIVSSSS